jgi:hypothetical protein
VRDEAKRTNDAIANRASASRARRRERRGETRRDRRKP